jgi:class 3 adenylate cyclase
MFPIHIYQIEIMESFLVRQELKHPSRRQYKASDSKLEDGCFKTPPARVVYSSSFLNYADPLFRTICSNSMEMKMITEDGVGECMLEASCFRALIIGGIVLSAAYVCLLLTFYARTSDMNVFIQQYHDIAMKYAESISKDISSIVNSAETLSSHVGHLYIPEFEYEKTSNIVMDRIPEVQNVHNFVNLKIRLCPSNYYLINQPILYAILTLFLVVLLFRVFHFYNRWNTLREHDVTCTAKKSEQIVDDLFPLHVKDRLFDRDNYQMRTSNYSTPATSRVEREADRCTKKRIHSCPEIKALYINEDEGLNTLLHPPTRRLSKESISSSHSSLSMTDTFPETSIMFADLVGFTKWSSDHEPEDVFHLLETLFFEFDAIAQRLGVFKVGTIGDCYIAATGIPEYTLEHAVVMCRFAYECRTVLREVLGDLEDKLGDTIGLSMRFGIHSGPVTAGVLRGLKSRFELFGDAMNTASRMESTSKPETIQISQATANYLIDAGHSDWFESRDDKVEVKVKGKLQTYWLLSVDETFIHMEMY